MPPLRLCLTRLLVVLALLCTSVWLQAAAIPRASVDRNVVTEGDSLTLTIRVDDTGGDAPDYSVLQRDFEVLDTGQSTQHSLTNGKLQSSTEWQATLMPKRSGELIIPAMAVDGGTTQPLAIRVAPGSNSSNSADVDSSEPVFLEAQLDRQSAYMQQQVILTVRIFQAIQLDGMSLSEPEFDNASVRKISEQTFRRDVRGAPYVVHELSYAIFPQQAGELTIPELVFNAVQPTTRRSMFDFPGQGRRLRKMTKQLQVTVKPIPKTFSGSVWLPARNLTLAESWSNSANAVNVGDSVTRNITVRADGLLASQLPALDSPQLDNAKIYKDQPSLDDQQDATGVHGKRTENMALIPNKAGDLQIPELRVVWWDVESDSEKVATLAPSTLRITGGIPTSAAPVTEPPQPSTAAAVTAPAATGAPPTTNVAANHYWQLATLLLALAWAITLYLYWRLRRGGTPARTLPATQRPVAASEAAAFDTLKDACRANDPASARVALIAWAREFHQAPQLRTTEQVLRISNHALLAREVQQLDNRLFGTHPESTLWNGENLLSVVRELRKQKPEGASDTEQLPPLYPT